MSSKKKCKLIHGESLRSSTPSPHSIDWSLCALCQEQTDIPLTCPSKSLRTDIGSSYDTLGNNLSSFRDISKQPVPVDLNRLDDGDGIANTLSRNQAKWHTSCRLKCSTNRLARLRPSTSAKSDDGSQPYMRRRTSTNTLDKESSTCFICDEPGTDDLPLHEAMTPQITRRVRQCALTTQNQKIIAMLSAGDLVALEAKYHTHCLVNLYNTNRRNIEEDREENTDGVAHGLALVELIGYIKEVKSSDLSRAPIFKLTDLVQLYTDRIKELGVGVAGRIHSTHLKGRILANVPGLQAHKQGRDVMLSFDDDIGHALREACVDDDDDEAICLAKAADIIRRDMLKKTAQFDGSFLSGCQEDSVPRNLVSLISMIMDGPNITKKETQEARQSALSIAQILKYNSCVRRRDGSTGTYHSKDRETPLPIYIGMMIHGHTRKRELVDTLFHLGLSISYDRVLDISKAMACAASRQYEVDGVVCPLVLRRNLFTTAAVDNLDHNPSSSTARGSFHGTGISLFQNRHKESDGIERENLKLETMPFYKQIPPLPDSYTNLTPVVLKKEEPTIPALNGSLSVDNHAVKTALEEEKKWHTNSQEIMTKDVQAIENPISWAAFHSIAQQDSDFSVTITSLLPLFPDDSKSVAMIRHSMDVIQRAVEFLNPGQVPVLTVDQPLFAIAKRIQWQWPDTYGEDKYVVLLGGLHIEMAALTTLGDFLEGSGWTNAITQADVAAAGMADSFLKATHVKRTRHAHQVTCIALSILLHDSYDAYHQLEIDPLPFEDWCMRRAETSPQFLYWFLVMQLEQLILVYVRSLREGNFSLYLSAISALAPLFFALDHTHYARWLSIHIRDMATLKTRLPEVARQFEQGGFIVHKTKRPFSALAIDHAHEQNNKIVKGDGGAVNLMENQRALLRWMVAGPEIARAADDFETNCLNGSIVDNIDESKLKLKHHEDTEFVKKFFAKEVKALVEVIDKMGNPFLEESDDLLVLDSRNVADPAIADSVRKFRKIGQDQYEAFMIQRMIDRTSSVTEPIKKNNLPMFRCPPQTSSSKAKQMVSSLKSDCALFSRLYIACQTREGDLENFFRHENHAYPPALSLLGKLRLGNKADLTGCLEKHCQVREDAPSSDVIILDGAAVINMLKPVGAKTFQEYSTLVFLPYIRSQLRNTRRVDIIWDVYLEDSLKSDTREKRGKGVRRRVAPTNTIPGNWQEFLRLADNKTELFRFLAHQVLENVSTEKEVYTTCDQHVLCTRVNQDVSPLAPCSHEEADTRIMLHAIDATNKGFRRIMIRTVDTDVLVLAVSNCALLNEAELWVAFGTGKHLRYIPAHDIAASLGEAKARALPMFHAFTGCDTVSSFAGRGKKTAFDIWNSFQEITTVFAALSTRPATFSEEFMKVIESYVILLYDRTCTESSVDSARKHIFAAKARSIDAIPPTQAALLQHTKRAIFQGGYVWGQAHICSPEIPSPESWGWRRMPKQGWEPLWTLLPEAAVSCSELLRCGCQKGCRGHCKCVRADLKCTSLCRCNGNCEHNNEI